MDKQKLVEDTIKVNALNKDGQVFDRGKYQWAFNNKFLAVKHTIHNINLSSPL